MIFFTDGLVEAHNPSGEEFGMKRLEAAVKEHGFHRPKGLVDNILKDVKNWVVVDQFEDDICVVAIEVTERPASEDLEPAVPRRA